MNKMLAATGRSSFPEKPRNADVGARGSSALRFHDPNQLLFDGVCRALMSATTSPRNSLEDPVPYRRVRQIYPGSLPEPLS